MAPWGSATALTKMELPVAELPEWILDIYNTASEDETCQARFMQRMLMQAMELKMQAQNETKALQALETHLDKRAKELERAERDIVARVLPRSSQQLSDGAGQPDVRD